MLSLLTMLMLAAGASSAQDLKASWNSFVQAHGKEIRMMPPALSDDDWEALGRQETITHRVKLSNSVHRVYAVRYIDQPPLTLWIAVMDGIHADTLTNVDIHTMATSSEIYSKLYYHLRLPFPATDRHWVLDLCSNSKLYSAASGSAWERNWDLDIRGERSLQDLPEDLQSRDKDSIWVPTSRGAWLFLAVSYGTLVFYQVEADVGGWVPEDLASRWTEWALKSLISGTAKLADRAAIHYNSKHSPIQAPDGTLLPYF